MGGPSNGARPGTARPVNGVARATQLPGDGGAGPARRPVAENRTGNPGAGATSTGSPEKVVTVHRIGALVVAAVIAVFGILGFAGGLGFFDTEGTTVAGLSTNGLLSTISLVTAAVLVLAALRSARTASTIMLIVGVLFLVSAFANLAILETDFNPLAFRLPNVFFSIAAGLVLLALGAYGRVSGNLPADNPYRTEGDAAEADALDDDQGLPETPAEVAAEAAMRDAELAVVNHTATDEQRRRVEAMARVRTRRDRREVWMDLDRQAAGRPTPERTAAAPSPVERIKRRLGR
ncbi:DUF4383 domain-containing protein [Modestobacter sp. I12A-02628]|uniref:DUF4383 domain-containing protein n=2 Tax=Goekera deserti TaxID=2497753 RepID=A0A7K3W9P1_9ACTN|nr:DUF4383 domain-containing protein [Goekera deserti]NDI49639.1 DUF4383 domain-containing protein [Goekera deserti]NEL53168.1 DUF4383 domain-containing protein [Goekera deserti]